MSEFQINLPLSLEPQLKSLIRGSFNEAIKSIRENGCSSECAYIEGQIDEKLNGLDSSQSLWVRNLGKISRALYLVYQDVDPQFGKGALKVPKALRVGVVAALFYLVNPFDIIPDYVAGTGYADDVLIINKVVSMFENQCPGVMETYVDKLG